MKKVILNILVRKNFVKRIAKTILFNSICESNTRLTGTHLTDKGFIKRDGSFFEENVKERDRLYITFYERWYSVRYGLDRTFITNESSLEWFELFYSIIHPDNYRI